MGRPSTHRDLVMQHQRQHQQPDLSQEDCTVHLNSTTALASAQHCCGQRVADHPQRPLQQQLLLLGGGGSFSCGPISPPAGGCFIGGAALLLAAGSGSFSCGPNTPAACGCGPNAVPPHPQRGLHHELHVAAVTAASRAAVLEEELATAQGELHAERGRALALEGRCGSLTVQLVRDETADDAGLNSHV